MNKPLQAVSIHILDREYRIACAEDGQAELLRSAQELDRQMRKVRDTGKVSGADRIAVLAALNLAHELNASGGGEVSGEMISRIADLRARIENVLENPQTV